MIKLVELLAELYDKPELVEICLKLAKINVTDFNFEGSSYIRWARALKLAQKHDINSVNTIIDNAIREYPQREAELRTYVTEFKAIGIINDTVSKNDEPDNKYAEFSFGIVIKFIKRHARVTSVLTIAATICTITGLNIARIIGDRTYSTCVNNSSVEIVSINGENTSPGYAFVDCQKQLQVIVDVICPKSNLYLSILKKENNDLWKCIGETQISHRGEYPVIVWITDPDSISSFFIRGALSKDPLSKSNDILYAQQSSLKVVFSFKELEVKCCRLEVIKINGVLTNSFDSIPPVFPPVVNIEGYGINLQNNNVSLWIDPNENDISPIFQDSIQMSANGLWSMKAVNLRDINIFNKTTCNLFVKNIKIKSSLISILLAEPEISEMFIDQLKFNPGETIHRIRIKGTTRNILENEKIHLQIKITNTAGWIEKERSIEILTKHDGTWELLYTMESNKNYTFIASLSWFTKASSHLCSYYCK